jgi:hypothetical protein
MFSRTDARGLWKKGLRGTTLTSDGDPESSTLVPLSARHWVCQSRKKLDTGVNFSCQGEDNCSDMTAETEDRIRTVSSHSCRLPIPFPRPLLPERNGEPAGKEESSFAGLQQPHDDVKCKKMCLELETRPY